MYKVSRDYKQLFDLANSGQRVACYVDYYGSIMSLEPRMDPPCRDLCECRKMMSGNIEVTERGRCFIDVNPLDKNSQDKFEKWCEQLNLAWILP